MFERSLNRECTRDRRTITENCKNVSPTISALSERSRPDFANPSQNSKNRSMKRARNLSCTAQNRSSRLNRPDCALICQYVPRFCSETKSLKLHTQLSDICSTQHPGQTGANFREHSFLSCRIEEPVRSHRRAVVSTKPILQSCRHNVTYVVLKRHVVGSKRRFCGRVSAVTT